LSADALDALLALRMAALRACFKHTPLTTEEADLHLEMWSQIVREVGWERFHAALGRVLNECKFFPTIAEVRERIPAAPKTVAIATCTGRGCLKCNSTGFVMVGEGRNRAATRCPDWRIEQLPVEMCEPVMELVDGEPVRAYRLPASERLALPPAPPADPAEIAALQKRLAERPRGGGFKRAGERLGFNPFQQKLGRRLLTQFRAMQGMTDAEKDALGRAEIEAEAREWEERKDRAQQQAREWKEANRE
jgi:hypothetical protein